MKLILIFYFFFLILTSKIYSQNATTIFGKVVYRSTLKQSLYIQGTSDITKNMIVYFSDTISSFHIDQPIGIQKEDLKKLLNIKDDVLFEEVASKIQPQISKRSKPNNYHHKIGTHIFINSWIDQSDITYCVADSVKEYEWSLLPDTTRILGFLCYKANCKAAVMDNIVRSYTVWYTPEIPIPVGPNKFYGLPGLILGVEDKYYSLLAKSINLNANRLESDFLKCCTEGKTISTNQYKVLAGKQSDEISNLQYLNKN
jgi:GLPGLI family protein